MTSPATIATTSTGTATARVNGSRTDDAYVLVLEVPGLTAEALDVKVEDGAADGARLGGEAVAALLDLEAVTVAARIKALRDCGAVFLNDGIYGGLAEWVVLGTAGGLRVVSPEGRMRQGDGVARTVFGPTCDSLDRIPGMVPLPRDMVERDYIVIDGMGAYSTATVTHRPRAASAISSESYRGT